MQALPSNTDDTHAAIDSLARLLVGRMNGACGELDRVDELLGHAIQQLIEVFSAIESMAGAAARSHGAANSAEQPNPAQLARQAVTALQFRDVVGQKLRHVREELKALGHGFEVFSQPLPGSGVRPLTPRIERLLFELNRSRAPSPVLQEQMHAGEVDLF